MSNLRRLSSAAGFKEVITPVKVAGFPIDAYFRLPLVQICIQTHAMQSAFICWFKPCVSAVFFPANFPQVCPSIVSAVAIDMVNFTGPPPHHVQKSEAVTCVSVPSGIDNPIPPGIKISGSVASTLSACRCSARKNPSIRTVMQDGFKVRLSQFHEALHKLIGIVTGGCRPQVTHYSTEIY